MQALILAGGQGTRLRPLTINTPKPIVPIGNEPFLLRQLAALKKAGVSDVTLALNYQPTAIENLLGDGAAFGVKLRYAIEPAPLGTAGAYKFAGKHLETSTIVLNGDILTDIDLGAVAAQHKASGAAATIVLKAIENPANYGLVETTARGEVVRFLEKPRAEEIAALPFKTVNTGMYVLEPSVLDLIPENENFSFEYQVFPRLLRDKHNFRAFVATDDYWLDIGTRERYLQAHFDLLAGRIKCFQIEKNLFCGAAENGGESCAANRCSIDRSARVTNSFLGENVVVEENAVVENSVVWANTRIGASASVVNSIIGFNCSIGKNARVGGDAVLGDNSVLTDFSCY